MYYSFGYGVENEEGLIAAILCSVISALFSGGIGVVTYVFRSIGVYSIARRRGLNNPWFAWVPVVNRYLLGSLSDQYQYVVKGKDKSKRKWLLALSIAQLVLYAVIAVMGIGVIWKVVGDAMAGFSQAKLFQMALRSAMRLLVAVFPLMTVSAVLAVIRYIALYDVYTSVDPKNSVLYTVLSVFFHVTEPFFLFFNRKRDDGMPPRREAREEAPVWEASEEEPWVNE